MATWSWGPDQAALSALTFAGGTERNEIVGRFQELMVAISMVRLTVSASEKCAPTSSSVSAMSA
ncbi:MAG: hypothetical protein JO141_20185 [Bradyrhizobium sp.]|nr:hypothetical protein [Bradyrhizobium sp.]